MVAIDLITEQELDKRFDTLSSKLKETLTSTRILSVVNQICGKNKITDEGKITIIHQIVGLVILGLIHSYDLGPEINEALSLENPKLSNAIAEELNAKIFLPIKAELEGNYHPINSVPSEEKASISKPISITPPIASRPTIAAPTPTAPSPKPITLSDVGWSKTPSAGPTIKPSPLPQAMPMPLVTSNPPSNPPQAPRATTAPAPTPMPTPTPIPKPAPKPTEPAPMMLHEDTTFKAAEKNSNFSLSKPGGSAEMSIGQNKIQAPIRPAVLEFGTSSARVPTPPKTPTFGIQPTRYMDFKPSLSSLPTASAGARNVSQITSTAPTPIPVPVPTPTPTPIPKSPATPTPPQTPPVPQPNKPIVKDFL